MMRPVWVSVIAIYFCVSGGLTLVGGLATFIAGATIGSVVDAALQGTGLEIATYIWLVAAVLVLLGVLQIWIGYGLWTLREWARAATLAITGLLLLLTVLEIIAFRDNPTLLVTELVFGAIYAAIIFYLLQPQVAVLFAGGGGLRPTFASSCPACHFPVQPDWLVCPRCQAPLGATQGLGGETALGTAAAAPPLEPTRVAEQPSLQVSAWLVVERGQQPDRRYDLQSVMEIGRDPARCQIVLDDSNVGRSHAKLIQEGKAYYLLDLGSVNATFVNDRRIDRRTLLYDGDRIRMGDTVLVFKKV